MCTTADGHRREYSTHSLSNLHLKRNYWNTYSAKEERTRIIRDTFSIVSTNLLRQDYIHTYIQRRNASMLETNLMCIAVTQIMEYQEIEIIFDL